LTITYFHYAEWESKDNPIRNQYHNISLLYFLTKPKKLTLKKIIKIKNEPQKGIITLPFLEV